MEHHALEVARQQQVAATAHDEQSASVFSSQASSFLSLAECRELNEATAAGLNAKRVMRLQTIITQNLHYLLSLIYQVINFVSFHCPLFLLNVTSISSPLAMPRSTKIFVSDSSRSLP